jgi:hypothetical protein
MLERGLGWIVLSASLAGLSGCSQELGPEVFPTTSVKGTITLSGRPISAGWIEFNPVEGTKGNLRSAPIQPDGSYSAVGVPVGRVTVNLINLHAASSTNELFNLPPGYFNFSEIPIRRDIPAGESTRLDFDLRTEGLDFRQRKIDLERMRNDTNE